MNPPRTAPPSTDLSTLALAGLGIGVGIAGLLWVGAWVAAITTGRVPPEAGLSGALAIVTNPGDPTAAWGTPMPGPLAYWTWTTTVLAGAVGVTVAVVVAWRRAERRRLANPRLLHGVATGPEVKAAAGLREVRRRARHARPSLPHPAGTDVGYRLGRSLHLVIPMILDAPGAVVTTSTRPDNLTVTLHARHAVGPIAVFDPQQLAAGVTGSLRWSPVRGCELPQTAMIRARALAAGTGMSRTVDGGDFWQAPATSTAGPSTPPPSPTPSASSAGRVRRPGGTTRWSRPPTPTPAPATPSGSASARPSPPSPTRASSTPSPPDPGRTSTPKPSSATRARSTYWVRPPAQAPPRHWWRH